MPNREVTTREASEFARDNGCFYMETSALDGTGVNQAFYKGTCLKLFKFLVWQNRDKPQYFKAI